ncbi:MAG: DUF5995 family protein [Vicinamibacterales bacterium]
MPTDAPLRPLPTTIDEVVTRLDTIAQDAVDTGSRHGYFAALYRRVTVAVRAGIQSGAFDDNPRMARLDVVFANRYIEAYDRRVRGLAPSLSWAAAFAAGSRPDLSVLQHLMLGMNAHINLDLGIAAATIAPGDQLEALHGDFNKINGVLASLLPTVEGQLREMSPTLDLMAGLAHDANRLDERIGNFSMNKARDAAWAFARRLNAMPSGTARALDIAARDTLTAALALKIQEPGPASALLGGADSAAVTAHIRILSRPATSDQAG